MSERVRSRPAPPAARIACLLVPDLPLAAALRAHPELAGRPLVIASGGGARAQVISASPEALRAGVRPGHALVHARALCPALRLRALSPALEQSAREALLDVARSVSPRVCAAPPGTGPWLAEAAVHLDAAGVRVLFRSEEGLAAALLARAEALGLPAVVAVASSRAAALALARQLAREGDGDARDEDRTQISVSRVLAPEAERTALHALAIDLLAAQDGRDDALLGALDRFGLRRLGDLARLPREGLVTRLGAGVRPLLALAHGEPDAVPLPVHEETHREEAIDVEPALDRLEPLLFVLRGLLGRLLERLALGGLVAGSLSLELGLEGGGRTLCRVAVATPTADVRALLGLARLALERDPPMAPVARIALCGEGARPRHDQLDLFRPPGPAPAELSRLLAELEALCGTGRVGAPRVANDLHPDAIELAPFTLQPSATAPGSPPPARPGSPPPASLALRRLRPVAPAEVRSRAGRPEWLRSRPASGRVLEAAGPWRTSGRWWTPQARFAFDHYDVLTEREVLARLRRDLVSGRWEVDGLYD